MTILPSTSNPLSWIEARTQLRLVLENYLRNRAQLEKRNLNDDEISQSILSKCIRYNLDLYAGTLLFSFVLLTLTIISLITKDYNLNSTNWNPVASIQEYKSQVAAAVILSSGSILSIWMVHRRRFLCLNDSNTSRRREIQKFLKAVATEESKASENNESTHSNEVLHSSGSAQTDIYPVYRTSKGKDGTIVACWSRIPSLLLVQGDYVALQIGDVVPANCVAIESCECTGNYARVNVGERLTLESFGINEGMVAKKLPHGRTTLPVSSEYLLTLCNKMQIFRVLDTPLIEFLRRPHPPAQPSQISRKVNDVRKFLSLLFFPIFFMAVLAVFARPNGTSGNITLTAPLLMLTALGILPVVGPFCIFFLETIGTARILATVHPYASTRKCEGGVSATGSSFEDRRSLLLRYMVATGISRLALWNVFNFFVNTFSARSVQHLSESRRSRLIRIPPASLNVLEKLGVATALVLVDDELACEPHSVPQQLLIPSGRGLKLLDLCPEYDDDSVNEDDSENMASRKRGKSFDSDSDSDDSDERLQSTILRRKILRRRRIRRNKQSSASPETVSQEPFDVQFEDPSWWQHLPSLKCIGLACLLADGKSDAVDDHLRKQQLTENEKSEKTFLDMARKSLIQLICNQRSSDQLQSLAQCIGFSTQPNSNGKFGDITPFNEIVRLHVLSDALFKERIQLDAHERSSEQSRWWGLIRPDATSVIVKDLRTHAFQLLTIGDPTIVTNLCNEAWQGEISTILPLAAVDKQKIIDTTNEWKLADLEVSAFCYSPVPHNMEGQLTNEIEKHNQAYLLDHPAHNLPLMKDKSISKEWSLIKNQIFLGVLGSLVVPRREIQKLLDTLNDAGVRFVYFSPRNMRRQKELAMQMGIDVSWNCAISLRPLNEGEEDPHRMVSNYADWDVNAKLPHGVDEVRKHLREVDNVPLLVSLFTDSTKSRTQQMVEIFQEYSDTVVSIGLSHLPLNANIFAVSDIAVGIDVLNVDDNGHSKVKHLSITSVLPSELEFVSSVASSSCAFRFRGAATVANISTIIEMSRASLEAAISAAAFLVTGCVSFSLYVLFSLCMPLSVMTYCPVLGSVLFLQIILPGISLSLGMSDGDSNTMQRVPSKNDSANVFGKKEGYSLYSRTLLKAVLPAFLPQTLHPIVYGALMIKFEQPLVSIECPDVESWIGVVRCPELHNYNGNVRLWSGCLVFLQFVICIIVSSASFVRRFNSVKENLPWSFNVVWFITTVFAFGLIAVYTYLDTINGIASSLPWQYYCLSIVYPCLSLLWMEFWKASERKLEDRAEKLRRLQFETRLGAWSPR